MKIFIYDEFSPEDTAMMQALYSRSPLSVVEHVAKVKATGSGKFMEKFYVGYGHASIADCGSTTIFIENLSILADKAIQDWPLYSGQETSTRYVDMSKQPIIDPLASADSKAILNHWMDFYINSQTAVQEYLKSQYPKKQEEDEAVYEKAIKARTFDIMRGFLPAGITTQLSWHTNLRQAWDKLCWLRHNSLPEVKEIAEQILNELKTKYAHSFSHPLVAEAEEYRAKIAEKYNFFNPAEHPEFTCRSSINNQELEEYIDACDNRPQKTGLPLFLGELGQVTFDFLLDYGSFRDIQRHRNGVCRIPLLTTKFGFNDWYLAQLPAGLKQAAEKLIEEQKLALARLNASPEIKQYYIALGFNAACRVTYALPATVYTVELRSGRMVHPTLRQVALKMHQALQEKFSRLKLNCDLGPDDWDVRRGEQDIVEKK